MNFAEKLERWKKENKAIRWEGQQGLANLENLLRELGYKSHGFKYGTVIETFLADNSGAVEALIEWIAEADVPEWEEALTEESDNDPCSYCGGNCPQDEDNACDGYEE